MICQSGKRELESKEVVTSKHYHTKQTDQKPNPLVCQKLTRKFFRRFL